jgi:hypothetical protein
MIRSNRKPKEELSEVARALTVAAVEIGMSYRDIAASVKYSLGTTLTLFNAGNLNKIYIKSPDLGVEFTYLS